MAKTKNKMTRRERLEQTKNRNELNAEQAFNLADRNNQARIENTMSDLADRLKRTKDRQIEISLRNDTTSYLGETPKEYFKGDLIDAFQFEKVSKTTVDDENFVSHITNEMYAGLGIPDKYMNTSVTAESSITAPQGKVEIDSYGDTVYVSTDGRRTIIGSHKLRNVPNHISTFPNTYGHYMGQDVYRESDGTLYMIDEDGNKKLLGNSVNNWQPIGGYSKVSVSKAWNASEDKEFISNFRKEVNRMRDTDINYIQHVNIMCTKAQFMEILSSHVDPSNIDVQNRTSNKGIDILQVTVKPADPKDGDCILLAKINPVNNTMISIEKLKLTSTGFISNLSMAMHDTLSSLAEANKGDYVGIVDGKAEMIIEGLAFRCQSRIIKVNTPIEYNTEIPKDIMDFKKSIKEYISENDDLKEAIKGMSMPDNMNVIAKHLLQKKLNEEISYEDFYGVFIQVCSLGVTDKTALNFYALLKQ